MRFCSFLRRLGIACHAVGLLMFLLGFMTVNWVIMPYRRGSAGLWQICYNRNISASSDGNSTGNNTSNHTSVFISGNRIRISIPKTRNAAASPHTTTTPAPTKTYSEDEHSEMVPVPMSSPQHKGFIKPVEDPYGKRPATDFRSDKKSLSRGNPAVAGKPKQISEDKDAERKGSSFSHLKDLYTEYDPDSKNPYIIDEDQYDNHPMEDMELPVEHEPMAVTPSNGESEKDDYVVRENADRGQKRERQGEVIEGYKSREDDVDEGGGVEDSLPSHIRLDNDGCRKYGVSDVDPYLHMVRTLMAITAFCYAYGIFNGSTRRARIQPRSSFTRQHRGELLSYTGAFLSYFAVQIYEFGFHSDTLVRQFVSRPQDLRLGWSAECVRFSSLMVAPSVLLLLAPTLRTKLRKLLSDCWAAIGCAGDEGGANGERRAGLLATLTHNFWQDPLGNCFRFITCQRAPIEGESASPDSEMGPVERPDYTRGTGLAGHGRDNFHPTDSRLLNAPPPPYSFLQPISSERSVSSYRSGLMGSDSGGDEQYFLVSGILSVAIPHRAVGEVEPAPSYQDIFPPPSYEEATQGIVQGVLSASQLPPTPLGPNSHMEAVSYLANPTSTRLSDSPASCVTAAPFQTSPPIVVSLAENSVSLPTRTSQAATPLDSQPTSILSLTTPSTPQSSSSTSSVPASSDVSTTLPWPMPDTPHPSSPSFLSYTAPSPTLTVTTQPLPTTPSSSPTTSQHQVRESAAAAVAAAVVSAAATTTTRQSFILPALRQYPQPEIQAEGQEPEQTSSSHVTTNDSHMTLATDSDSK